LGVWNICDACKQVGSELKKKVMSLQENASTVSWLLRQRPSGGCPGRKRRAIDRAVEVIGIGGAKMRGLSARRQFCGLFHDDINVPCGVISVTRISSDSKSCEQCPRSTSR